MSISASVLASPWFSQRRLFRVHEPRQQIRLAFVVLAISAVFGALATWNSYSAYATLLGSAVQAAPAVYEADLIEQTQNYAVVSSVLALGYALAVVGASIAFVHWIAGPTVALKRHARALVEGDYSSRVTLRGSATVHADLARHLNDLATSLEREQAGRAVKPLVDDV
jgi:HAMP domain-containing protein